MGRLENRKTSGNPPRGICARLRNRQPDTRHPAGEATEGWYRLSLGAYFKRSAVSGQRRAVLCRLSAGEKRAGRILEQARSCVVSSVYMDIYRDSCTTSRLQERGRTGGCMFCASLRACVRALVHRCLYPCLYVPLSAPVSRLAPQKAGVGSHASRLQLAALAGQYDSRCRILRHTGGRIRRFEKSGLAHQACKPLTENYLRFVHPVLVQA
jgi:hypothetical protein